MEGSNDTAFSVGNEDGDTIGGLHADERAGFVRGQTVTFDTPAIRTLAGDPAFAPRRQGSIAGGVDQGGMDLAEGFEWGFRVAGDGFGEKAAIGGDGCAVVGGGEAEVEFAGGVVGAVGAAEASLAGRESVPEPGVFIPAGNREPANAVCGHLRWGGSTGELFRGGARKAHAGGDAGGIAMEVAGEAGEGEQGVDFGDILPVSGRGCFWLWFGAGRRVTAGGGRLHTPILAAIGFCEDGSEFLIENQKFSSEKGLGLPSGRPFSEAVKGGGPGGEIGEEVQNRTFKKEWVPFLEGLCYGEASADYLVRCGISKKVT